MFTSMLACTLALFSSACSLCDFHPVFCVDEETDDDEGDGGDGPLSGETLEHCTASFDADGTWGCPVYPPQSKQELDLVDQLFTAQFSHFSLWAVGANHDVEVDRLLAWYDCSNILKGLHVCAIVADESSDTLYSPAHAQNGNDALAICEAYYNDMWERSIPLNGWANTSMTVAECPAHGQSVFCPSGATCNTTGDGCTCLCEEATEDIDCGGMIQGGESACIEGVCLYTASPDEEPAHPQGLPSPSMSTNYGFETWGDAVSCDGDDCTVSPILLESALFPGVLDRDMGKGASVTSTGAVRFFAGPDSLASAFGLLGGHEIVNVDGAPPLASAELALLRLENGGTVTVALVDAKGTARDIRVSVE